MGDVHDMRTPIKTFKPDLHKVGGDIDDLWHHLTFDNKKRENSSGKERIRK
jgi:hypothetical protein